MNLDLPSLALELPEVGTHDADTLVSICHPSVSGEQISANATNGPEEKGSPGVVLAKQKEELEKYHTNLVFEPGNYVVCLSFSARIHI